MCFFLKLESEVITLNCHAVVVILGALPALVLTTCLSGRPFVGLYYIILLLL